MYQNMTLEQIKLFLKHTKQDIIVTKLNRNIVASEFHLIGAIEVFKAIQSLDLNNITLSPAESFWLKNPNVDILMFSIMTALGIMWYSYQNSLNNLYETEIDLKSEKDKKVLLNKLN